jgi:hypothetical protein
VAGRLTEQLGDRLRGAWLVGSAAIGGFQPERSDLDVQAVATVVLPEPERRRLAQSLSHEALPCPARGLEFVLYAEADLLRVEGPAFQLNLNTGARMARHVAFDPAADPRFWFVIDVAMAREHNRRLAGASAEDVLPELPRALVLRALLDSIAWRRQRDDPYADPGASACRAWAWATDGRWRSKPAAVEWARGRVAADADLPAAAEAVLLAALADAASADDPAPPAGA